MIFQVIRMRRAVIITQIHVINNSQLFQIPGAADGAGLFTGSIQSRQQHSRQYSDDRNYNEELYQGKSIFSTFGFDYSKNGNSS